MTLLIYILLSLFIISNVMAGQVVIGSGDLPYTAENAKDTITFDANKITSATNGILVSASNVVILLQDDTLEFGTGDGDNNYGIKVDWHRDDLKIVGNNTLDNGGTIIHGGSGWDNSCVLFFGDCTGSTLEDVDMEIYGWDGHNVECFDADISDLTISGGSWINHVEGFTSRTSFDATCLWAEDVDSVVVHDLIIDCWHSGMFFGDYVKSIVYNCSLLVDARNDLYSYPTDNYSKTSAASCGIHLWKPLAGSQIYDNIIIAGIENEGCEQAITADIAEGTESDPILIHDNFAILHRGPDDHYGDAMTCKGYKQRWSNQYVYVYDNEFHISAHADSGDHASAWGIHAEGLYYQITTEESNYCDSNILVENNRCFVEALSAGCDATGALLSIQGCGSSYNFTQAGNVWRNNYFKTTSYGYWVGEADPGYCNTFLGVGDTLDTYDDDGYYCWRLGSWNGACTSNVFRNIIYLNEADEDDIEYYDNEAAEGSDLSLEKTLSILVLGEGSIPLEDVEIGVVSDYSGADTLYDTTDASGLAYPIVRYARYFHTTPADSLAYNDFVIRALHSDSTIYDTLAVDWETFSTSISFSVKVQEIKNIIGKNIIIR